MLYNVETDTAAKEKSQKSCNNDNNNIHVVHYWYLQKTHASHLYPAWPLGSYSSLLSSKCNQLFSIELLD